MTTEEKLVWSNLAVHPGESLAEEMEFRGTSIDELAAQSGLPAQLLCKIVKGEKPITAPVARSLASSLEIPAQFWINLQTKYDLTLTRNKQASSSTDAGKGLPAHDIDAHIPESVLLDQGCEWVE